MPTVQAPCPAMARAACPMRRVWCCWVPETCRCPARRHHEVFRAVAGWILGYAGPVLRHVVQSTWMRLVRHWHAIRTDICSMYRDVSFRNPQFSPASLRRRLVGTASARHWHGNGTPAAVGSLACIWVYRQPRPSPTCRWERLLPSPLPWSRTPDGTRTARQQRPGSVSTSPSRPVQISPSRRVCGKEES